MTTSISEERKFTDSEALNVKQTNPKSQSYVNTATSLTELSNDKNFVADGFYIYKSGKFLKASTRLSLSSITFESESLVENIRLDDVLGATVKEANLGLKKLRLSSEDAEFAKGLYALKIHLLVRPFKNDKDQKEDEEDLSKLPESRKYQKFIVYGNDEKLLSQWRNLILQAANNPDFENLAQGHSVGDMPQFSRKFLVFVMSASGKGKAKEYWQKCKKLLDRSGCESEEIFAEKIDAVEEYIDKSSTEDLQKFGAIMSVSGDGLPAYLINKFYQRPDWRTLADIPIMLLPGGSCCALTQNCVAKGHEAPSIEGCCYILSKGRSFKADIIELEHEDGKKTHSFLEIMWASTANIDLDSETFRFLGNVRFDIHGAWEVLNLKKYKAKFSYSPKTDKPPSFDQELKEGWTVLDDEFSYFGIHNMPWVGIGYEAIPMSDHDDGLNYFMALKGEKISRKNLLNTRKLLNPNAHRYKEEKDFEELGLTIGKFGSFRLEPYGDKRGKYSVDGEECEDHKIQGHILPKVQSFVGGLKKH